MSETRISAVRVLHKLSANRPKFQSYWACSWVKQFGPPLKSFWGDNAIISPEKGNNNVADFLDLAPEIGIGACIESIKVFMKPLSGLVRAIVRFQSLTRSAPKCKPRETWRDFVATTSSDQPRSATSWSFQAISANASENLMMSIQAFVVVFKVQLDGDQTSSSLWQLYQVAEFVSIVNTSHMSCHGKCEEEIVLLPRDSGPGHMQHIPVYH